MKKTLSLHNISFRFSLGKPPFFKNLSVDFYGGKINFVCGKNGSGKSTLFRVIQGKRMPHEEIEGTVAIGQESYVLGKQEQHQAYTDSIKLVHQKFDTMLADQFDGEQNLRLANIGRYPLLSRLPSFHTLKNMRACADIDLKKPVHLLSGGQRQILAMLMVLQKTTNILLLDEPTAALDEHNAFTVMRFLQELAHETGLIILVISHDRDLINRYADGAYYEICVDHSSGIRKLLVKSALG